MDYVSMQIAEYAHQQGVLDSMDEAIDKRAKELMEKGGDFYPYDPVNLPEALGSLDERQLLTLSKALEQAEHQPVVSFGGVLCAWVNDYWAKQAADYAAREMGVSV